MKNKRKGRLQRFTKRREGRSVHDLWAEAGRRTGGRFVPGDRPEIRVEHGPWTVIVDKDIRSNGQTVTVYTRTRAYYLANDDFGFRMSRRRWYSGMAAFFFSEARVRDQALKEEYVFRSTHESRLRSFLQDGEVRRLILGQPSMRLELKGLSWWQRRKRGSRVRVVTARTTGVLTDVERIVNFIELIRASLDTLQRIGTAVPQKVEDGWNGEVGRKLGGR